ncbi:MAG: hypothetical protein ACJ8MO_11750 [Bacillus sp. (in: firmicutes)]
MKFVFDLITDDIESICHQKDDIGFIYMSLHFITRIKWILKLQLRQDRSGTIPLALELDTHQNAVFR